MNLPICQSDRVVVLVLDAVAYTMARTGVDFDASNHVQLLVANSGSRTTSEEPQQPDRQYEWPEAKMICITESCLTRSKLEIDDHGRLTFSLYVAGQSSVTTTLKLDTFQYASEGSTGCPFQKQLSKSRRSYENKHGLDGHSKVRTWGLGTHTGDVVTCVTFHPSDMIEYVTPALEQSTLMFSCRTSQQRPRSLSSIEEDHEHKVLKEILRWVLTLPIRVDALSKMDCAILGIAAAQAYLRFEDEGLLELSWTTLRNLSQVRNSSVVQLGHGDAAQEGVLHASAADSDVSLIKCNVFPSFPETCEICAADISFTDASYARCQTGHTYSK